ncbi:flavin-containing monooxygenase FMO GS-OX-like 4 isoform X3 [Anoplophora glabripennis]|nr:flavin-containing monooxygenase FMO GS-OX-like 4 isoform X3 [Anoplophora glabripennis]XP_018577363.1 flavin-containing monooxygenase FMO GS-OX-like 4 isoform X3 [Anoplophora glabripennis]
MKIAIIGSGAAGLAALKHSIEDGHDCIAYEKSGNVGGTWNYSDNVGVDEYGLPIHSSMYYGLRTNLPKELMQYENFPYKESKRSILFQEEVLTYINNYANAFNLLRYVKFFKHVIEVAPLPGDRWTIKIKDLKTNTTETKEYDVVIVCVGNYSIPKSPNIEGLDKFKGKVIHSHIYRKSDPFKNKRVIVIGGGPSGVDISRIIAEVADKVYVSLKSGTDVQDKFSEKVIIKPEILKFTENTVVFEGNSEENIDDIIFCTGYIYSYPFLSPNCGIQVEDNWVKYLYKQIININHPTMAFIGVPFRVTPFPMFGIQVRFFLKYLKGGLAINKAQMRQDLDQYMQKKKEEGQPTHYAHFLGLKQGWYMDDLADTANIKRVPSVIQKLYAHFHSLGKKKFKMSFKLLNDDEFQETELS